MNRVAFVVLAITLLFVRPAEAQAPHFAIVAAWNIEGFEEISDARARRHADAIAEMEPHVLAVSEVNPESVLGDIRDRLKSKHGLEYEVAGVPPQSGGVHQRIGILHRKDVSVSHIDLIDGSDDGNPRLRKAVHAFVRIEKFDFHLVAVHLKAGRGKKEREVRSRQNKKIVDWIQQTVNGSPERDFLVVGDYNMVPGQDFVNFEALNFKEASLTSPNQKSWFLKFTSRDDLPSGSFSHIEGSGGKLLDGYAISKQHTREYVPNSTAIVQLHERLGLSLGKYADRLSDHLPIEATFRVDQPDDDP